MLHANPRRLALVLLFRSFHYARRYSTLVTHVCAESVRRWMHTRTCMHARPRAVCTQKDVRARVGAWMHAPYDSNTWILLPPPTDDTYSVHYKPTVYSWSLDGGWFQRSNCRPRDFAQSITRNSTKTETGQRGGEDVVRACRKSTSSSPCSRSRNTSSVSPPPARSSVRSFVGSIARRQRENGNYFVALSMKTLSTRAYSKTFARHNIPVTRLTATTHESGPLSSVAVLFDRTTVRAPAAHTTCFIVEHAFIHRLVFLLVTSGARTNTTTGKIDPISRPN